MLGVVVGVYVTTMVHGSMVLCHLLSQGFLAQAHFLSLVCNF